MIAIPTDDELRQFLVLAKDPNYGLTRFDVRLYKYCIIGHILFQRGDRTWYTDRDYRDLDAAIFANGNTRLTRLLGVERKPSNWKDGDPRFTVREDIAIRFTLSDAINAVTRYFDDQIEETSIWPWAARGFPHMKQWSAVRVH